MDRQTTIIIIVAVALVLILLMILKNKRDRKKLFKGPGSTDPVEEQRTAQHNQEDKS